MNRLSTFVSLAIAVCLLQLLSSAAHATPPNVLVILADDLGYSDLGCYGSEIQTPNLDKLASDGLRYTQFYNTARCWPTRGALLTGYYAQQIRRDALPGGKGGGRGVRPDWAQLLPQILKPIGYRSYLSGKWHVDGVPEEQGFDHSYVIEDHDRYHNPKKHTKDGKKLPAIEPGSGFYLTTAIADHAIECLQEHASQHSKSPFFHFLTFTSPHFPLHALPQDIAKYKDVYQSGWDAMRAARYERQKRMQLINAPLAPLENAIGPPYDFPEAIAKLGPGEVNKELPWNSLTPEQQKFQAGKMTLHAAMIDRMDQEIGRVLAQLKSMNAFDNTLILFLSDNGSSAEIMIRGDGHDPTVPMGADGSYLCLGPGWSRMGNTPFRRHKTWVHEGGISTPLIAHWPAGIPEKGGIRNRVGHVIDIAPTIVELAGGKWPTESKGLAVPTSPGESFVASMTDAAKNRSNALWWLHEGNRALRKDNWKVVAAKNESWQLYDLSKDRAETKDLSTQHPDVLQQLTAMWQEMTDKMEAELKGN